MTDATSTDRSWTPIPVALICAGMEHGHWRDIQPMFTCDHWHHWHVSPDLPRDPHAGGIGHNENGTHPVTIREVFAQDNFAELLQKMEYWCVDRFIEFGPDGSGLVVTSQRGEHRSDVVVRKLAEALNAVLSPSGHRLFNCMIFPLNEAYGWKSVQVRLDEAWKWREDPRTLIPSTAEKPKSHSYGWLEVMLSQCARRNFEQLHKYERDTLLRQVDSVIFRHVPDDIGLLESTHRSLTGPLEPTIDEKWEHVLREAHSDIIWVDGVAYAPLVKPQVDDRPPRPPWASLDFDVDKWWDLLQEYDIDQTAQRNLFFLAQLSEAGKYQALDLLMKLQHKMYKNEITDASHWLHSSCSKARARLS